MKKRYLFKVMPALVAGLSLTVFTESALASLTVQGTVMYDGALRNLIYDNDLDITWLDYSRADDTWDNQMTWANNLSLIVNGVTFNGWRLPNTVDDLLIFFDLFNNGMLPNDYWYSGEFSLGCNNTSSEMGHLFYTELGNKAPFDTNGNYQPDWGLTNKGPFDNLIASSYWSGTETAVNPDAAWGFDMSMEFAQYTGIKNYCDSHALAVHPGQVSGVGAPVPEPTTLLLLGTGLAGLAGSRLRRKKQ